MVNSCDFLSSLLTLPSKKLHELFLPPKIIYIKAYINSAKRYITSYMSVTSHYAFCFMNWLCNVRIASQPQNWG